MAQEVGEFLYWAKFRFIPVNHKPEYGYVWNPNSEGCYVSIGWVKRDASRCLTFRQNISVFPKCLNSLSGIRVEGNLTGFPLVGSGPSAPGLFHLSDPHRNLPRTWNLELYDPFCYSLASWRLSFLCEVGRLGNAHFSARHPVFPAHRQPYF